MFLPKSLPVLNPQAMVTANETSRKRHEIAVEGVVEGPKK
jgi:hypothetical protein